jgi:uncharacterized protein (DUF1330 family)
MTMKLWWKFAIVAVAGAGIGAIATRMLEAQSLPRAYLVAEVQVTDAEAYKPYIPSAARIVAKHGGQYLARGGKSESLEGMEPAGRVAIVQFPSMAILKQFYDSPEYREVAPIRQKASRSRFFAVEGVAP